MRNIALSCLIAAALTITTAKSSQQKEFPRNNETIWFALGASLSGGFIIEPIARVSKGKLLPIPNGCRDKDPSYEEFRKAYAAPTRSYKVFFRGKPAGSVSVLKTEGSFAPYPVEYKGLAPIEGPTEALVTNAARASSGISSRQIPTAAEQHAANSIAKKLFVKAGVPLKSLTRLKVENLTRTILLSSKRPSLIGSFSISLNNSDSGIVHNLFFIATTKGGSYFPELSWTHISRGETDNENLLFIDQANLFDDGEEEVITGLGLYENQFYRVYERKKNSSRWEQIFEIEAPGCE